MKSDFWGDKKHIIASKLSNFGIFEEGIEFI